MKKHKIIGRIVAFPLISFPLIFVASCSNANDFNAKKGDNFTKNEVSNLVKKAEDISDATISKMNAILAWPKNKENLEKISKSNILMLDSGATSIKTIEKLNPDGNIRTPEFYSILYSSQKNKNFPGFGFKFPTPNKKINNVSSPNLVYLNGVGYGESAGANSINTYEAFKKTADYAFYLTEPVEKWAFDFETRKTNSVQNNSIEITNASVKEEAQEALEKNEQIKNLINQEKTNVIEGVKQIQLVNRQIYYNSIWGGPIGLNSFIDSIAKTFKLVIPNQNDLNNLDESEKNQNYQPMDKTVSQVVQDFLDNENNLKFSKTSKTLNISNQKKNFAGYFPILDMSVSLGFNPNFVSQYVKQSGDSNLLSYQVSWPMYLNNLANDEFTKSTSLSISKTTASSLSRYNLETLGIEWWQNEDVNNLGYKLAKTGMGGNSQTVTPGTFKENNNKEITFKNENEKPYGWNLKEDSKIQNLSSYNSNYASPEIYQVVSNDKTGNNKQNTITWKWLYNPYNAFVSYASYIKNIYEELV